MAYDLSFFPLIKLYLWGYSVIENPANHWYFSISKLKYKNLNSFSQLLLLLSGDVSLNQGLIPQYTIQRSNEWNGFIQVFELKQLLKLPTSVATVISTIIDHF